MIRKPELETLRSLLLGRSSFLARSFGSQQARRVQQKFQERRNREGWGGILCFLQPCYKVHCRFIDTSGVDTT